MPYSFFQQIPRRIFGTALAPVGGLFLGFRQIELCLPFDYPSIVLEQLDIVCAKSHTVNLFLHIHNRRRMMRRMNTKAPKRPPSDRGQGRKPISPDGEAMRSRPIRMTDSEWAKCMRLGGAGWVREKISKAKESK